MCGGQKKTCENQSSSIIWLVPRGRAQIVGLGSKRFYPAEPYHQAKFLMFKTRLFSQHLFKGKAKQISCDEHTHPFFLVTKCCLSRKNKYPQGRLTCEKLPFECNPEVLPYSCLEGISSWSHIWQMCKCSGTKRSYCSFRYSILTLSSCCGHINETLSRKHFSL